MVRAWARRLRAEPAFEVWRTDAALDQALLASGAMGVAAYWRLSSSMMASRVEMTSARSTLLLRNWSRRLKVLASGRY